MQTSDKRDKTLIVWISAAERRALKMEALLTGQTITEAVRALVIYPAVKKHASVVNR